MRMVDAHIISTCCLGGKDKIDDFQLPLTIKVTCAAKPKANPRGRW